MKYSLTKTRLQDVTPQVDGSYVYIKAMAVFTDDDAMIEGCKVGIAYNGNKDVIRAYVRGESLTAHFFVFSLGNLSDTELKKLETRIFQALEKHFFREPTKSAKGKKSEKFHCTRSQALAIVQAVLDAA